MDKLINRQTIKAGVYTKVSRKRRNEKKSIGLIILTGVYKFNNENVLQLKNKEDSHPLFKKIMSCPSFQKFCVLIMHVQKS